MVLKMQYEQVKELIDIFERTDLNDMEVRLGDASLRLSRGRGGNSAEETTAPIVVTEAVSQAVSANSKPSANAEASKAVSGVPETAAATGDKAVTAPIVGTFYQASAPDKPPFVKVGDTISKGDVVCIIEAMKFMNEVTSEVSGTITEILVEDGQFVEFGQELFRVK
ncbi:MAG: acetyl-CoA carboxylase biotin carboxyl carrier protein [Lachnospiraceae bacterium]|nr:acetyl-CoA carboxylase biotin carboxyl carrier protein [Lachnospiraceae bacterium]